MGMAEVMAADGAEGGLRVVRELHMVSSCESLCEGTGSSHELVKSEDSLPECLSRDFLAEWDSLRPAVIRSSAIEHREPSLGPPFGQDLLLQQFGIASQRKGERGVLLPAAAFVFCDASGVQVADADLCCLKALVCHKVDQPRFAALETEVGAL